MPTYNYTAKNRSGQEVSGEVIADNSALALGKVRELGFEPDKIRAAGYEQPRERSRPIASSNSSAGRRFAENFIFPVSSGVPLKELAQFYRQFATMIQAGIPLYQSLTTLVNQTKNPKLKEILIACDKQVAMGGKLSDVFQHYNWVFSELQIEMIRAAEYGGGLDKMLLRIAGYLEQEMALRSMISRLTLYPKLVVFAAIMILGKSFFATLTPAFSLLIIGGMGKSDYTIMSYLWDTVFFIAIIAIIIFGIEAFCKIFLFQNEAAEEKYEEFKMRLPLIGKCTKGFALAKFGRAFGAMYEAGLPMSAAIRIGGNASGSKVIARATRKAVTETEKGAILSQSLRATGVFPPMVLDMLHTGEQTGNVDAMMTKVAEYLEGDAESRAHQSAHIFAAVVGLFVGAAVGFAVIRFYMGMGSQIQTNMNDAN
ncbi:MAG: type II secretion system F family protein [Chthonomonadales bacterium]